MVGRSAAGFVTLALVVVGVMGVTCWAKHSFLQQSFDELVLECAELLSIAPSKMTSLRTGVLRNDNDTKCLVRCVGVSGRFWNDYTGMRMHLLGLYFNAASGDTANVNRTQACLDKLPSQAPRKDFCDLAFESFLCFYHNYGNLHRHRVFVPLDNMQLLHVTARCMEVHRITVEDLMSLTEDELDENLNVHCLVRCIGVQTGIYSDRYGVNLDLVYTQYGEGHDERKYKEDAQACLMRHTGTSCSPCRRAYNMLYKCFENVRNVITEFELPDSNED
ncbi:general odorant-binding protein 45-like [Anopheles ziemanni]|uniref:general odorant-binding protein 45-like n=1 Tax=Anopheles coustani TaxID=139045 RepID=UPI00265AB3F2|nr:general odorant-binding protein 45-like [Anopheles coustani]XP_058178170.1 general odorant-binding protein 45-like [Anopheles ziemanni]